ncbi:DUF4132 domain-containing protein [Pedobacter sp. HDW13]|uniref:DUF4132 domain-containing protein n=1 Tax=Pedobacter sp. HDW13 TaxID=2714940 RepID=UPI00140E8463|nr:DUF4132 domain-containing protein [Pedobacter sp. HDW13]QIL40407.1 DUF4132 domain-containing protein [Pedobacter sp. HDW13]
MKIFDKIKHAINSAKDKVSSSLTEALTGENPEFKKIISDTRDECLKTNEHFYDVKFSSSDVYQNQVQNWTNEQKTDFLRYCIKEIDTHAQKDGVPYNSISSKDNIVRVAYLTQLLRTKIHYSDSALIGIVNDFFTKKLYGKWSAFNQWPIALFINQLLNQYKNEKPGEAVKAAIIKLKKAYTSSDQATSKEVVKLKAKLDELLFEETSVAIKPTLFIGEDAFAAFANPMLLAMENPEKQLWFDLLAKAQKATGAKPSKKYLDESLALIKTLGTDKFKKVIASWVEFVIAHKESSTEHTYGTGAQRYTYTLTEFLSGINLDAIKGFIWICAHFHDQNTLNLIAKLAERCFKKIPGKGPTAAGLGNACLYTLYKSKGLDGIGHLSRLKLRIKQSNTQTLIEKYIAEAAAVQGVSTHDIEDMAVEDFKLEHGKRSYSFEDYTCTLQITGVGKSVLNWVKPDDSPQKSVPAFIKEKYASRLKKIKDTQKQIDQNTSAQRDRIDRLFRTGREWNYENFEKYFLHHGLVSTIAEKIIWTFTNPENNSQQQSLIKINDGWIDNKGNQQEPKHTSRVSLWHPALASTQETTDWRSFLTEKKIQQPLKQAYREVYLLTDAEINTRTYSNRMASHILKQHQFNMLAKTRGWKYSLLGAYDDGRYNQSAQVNLPEYNLRAEYWINEVAADDAFNDTGIWNYISTDQVRFVDTTNDQLKNLIDIPALPLSEVLRDVDLFVGVASVGNDPTWQDSGGLPAYRDYWTAFSFGELSEVAKNRKEIITNLLPRLKISKVAQVKDKFLIVQGTLRTYKIHLGSTNILMEPNDQYLCIVPDRSQKNHTENLFIPFEGDAGLSVILSKAFLLAQDDKITDSTITSQINRS